MLQYLYDWCMYLYYPSIHLCRLEHALKRSVWRKTIGRGVPIKQSQLLYVYCIGLIYTNDVKLPKPDIPSVYRSSCFSVSNKNLWFGFTKQRNKISSPLIGQFSSWIYKIDKVCLFCLVVMLLSGPRILI